MRSADIQKVPSLDYCKLLGCNLIICSNPSGVFSTVTHSVVQVVQVVREPLLDRSSLRHVVATAQPLNRSAPRHRYRARATAQNRSTLRHVIAAAQPLTPPSAQPSASSARTTYRRHLFMLRAGVSFILQAHQNSSSELGTFQVFRPTRKPTVQCTPPSMV